MDVEHQRLEIIAQNLANANTTRTATGEAYQPLRLVSGPRVAAFDAQLAAVAATSNGNALSATSYSGVQTFGVEASDAPPRLVYDPTHPHADAKGFVHYPGLDHAGEMALMVQTLRVYEANTVMFSAARSMYMRALDLGSKG
ncbi:flagellar basal body rod protein FlgC [Caballeronia telluris]|uniref:Flagellar basal-body rod protein FlgC n=2 Tax=Caballeronia telluris TaxID=326475 RepID=A0A158ESY5_9BURK|nr:flagellar basal body rod protein FlgC [Caballeronia telluris]